MPAQAIVLANLCVSYIMTSDNEKAEDVMRRIEKEVCVARVSVWLSAVFFFLEVGALCCSGDDLRSDAFLHFSESSAACGQIFPGLISSPKKSMGSRAFQLLHLLPPWETLIPEPVRIPLGILSARYRPNCKGRISLAFLPMPGKQSRSR